MLKHKECIACAEKIQLKAVLCKHCGIRQDDEAFIEAGTFNWNVLGYPTEEHEIAESWAEAEAELQKAFEDIGILDAQIEARNDGVNHVLMFVVGEAIHFVGFQSGRWLQIEIVNEESIRIDDGLSDVGPIPPRALAINAISWLIYFLMKKAAFQVVIRDFVPGAEQDLGTEFQASLFTLTTALERCKDSDFWLSMADTLGEPEAFYLAAVAKLGDAALQKKIKEDLTPKAMFDKFLRPMLPDMGD